MTKDPRENCMIREFDGCRCASADECQSYAAQVERRRDSRKSQRDAEATVRAKYSCDSAVSYALAVLFVAVLLTASFFLFAVPEGKRLAKVNQEITYVQR